MADGLCVPLLCKEERGEVASLKHSLAGSIMLSRWNKDSTSPNLSLQKRGIRSGLISTKGQQIVNNPRETRKHPQKGLITNWRECSKKHALSPSEGSVQSCPELAEGKAEAILTRGAYSQYVSTAKGRERRWRLFSPFPFRRPTNYLTGGSCAQLPFLS